MRFCLWLLLLLTAATISARAADNAERAVIGFSPDGRYFAFEQYGVQDGSGFPYSEIFVIDVNANSWVKGSPFRARVEDDGALLSAARTKAAKAASGLISALKISEPGQILASQPVTEVSPDRRRVSFDAFYQLHKATGRYTLSLDLVPFPAPQNCYADDGKQMGFKLTITDNEQKTSKEVYADTAIPSSRYCPRDYDIADVVVHGAHVALIGVYTPGFEGADRRLIAVPFKLP